MSYIAKILERADIRQIRNFLLDGVESPKENNNNINYEKRLEDAGERVFEKAEEKLPEILDDIFNYYGVVQNVYMEVGMKCGAKIAAQLLGKQEE